MGSNLATGITIGIVEGVTEFLPISSTGHMILVGNWLGFTGEKAETFEIFIQLGAILAVVALYRDRFFGLLRPGQSRGFAGRNGLLNLSVACLPAFIMGFLFHKKIKDYLFAPLPVAIALIFGGVILLLIERRKAKPRTLSLDGITFLQALGVGLFQCLALWPGISRSGSMIVGGLLLGMTRIAAAEFSFLVAVPVMAAAAGYDLMKSYTLLSGEDIPLFATGFGVALITAVLAIRFFLGMLQRYSLAAFGWYRIALGMLVLTTLSL